MKKIMIAAVLALSGCASIGNDFQYKSSDIYGRDTLEIGSPSAKYATMFGEPFYSENKITENGNFRLTRYQYAHANMADANSRLLDLEFRNEILNSFPVY